MRTPAVSATGASTCVTPSGRLSQRGGSGATAPNQAPGNVGGDEPAPALQEATERSRVVRSDDVGPEQDDGKPRVEVEVSEPVAQPHHLVPRALQQGRVGRNAVVAVGVRGARRALRALVVAGQIAGDPQGDQHDRDDCAEQDQPPAATHVRPASTSVAASRSRRTAASSGVGGLRP